MNRFIGPGMAKAQTVKSVMGEMSDEFLQHLIDKRGNAVWVVLNKAGTTVVKDPGMNRPFSTTVKKRAEQVARECGGHATTLTEAIEIITKNSKPND